MEMGYRNKTESPSGVAVAAPGRWVSNSKHPKDVRLSRQRTLADIEVWRMMPERPSSLTLVTQGTSVVVPEGVRPKSEMDAGVRKPKLRVPILGPTRQQTELYLKKRSKRISRHNVVPMDGPAQELTVGSRLQEVAVFDDKAANDVLIEAESQIRSGYPTIAASTLVNRNSYVDESIDDSHTAIKFFSELVKPVKYRWKFQKEQLKTILPSKQGFHPRSQSPTFQRLVEANEKLHGLVKRRSGVRKSYIDDEDSKSDIGEACEKPAILRYAKSESMTHRVSDLSNGLETVTPKLHERAPLRSESRTIEPHKVDAVCFDEDEVEENDDDDDYKSPIHTPPNLQTASTSGNKISEFKVDFKKMDSHSELHLFLPQIDDANSRIPTPENKRTRNNLHKVALPNISVSKDISDYRTHDEDKVKQKRSQKSDYKKKRKKIWRIKSGNEEKEIRDRLNDVPTLISLENEKPDEVLHSSSMCAFDNCPQHPQFRKSNKIRQA